MIQVFKTNEDYKKWLDGQRLPSGIVVYVSDDETMYFSTNNIKGELKTYECKKEEPIQPNKLVYSTRAAGSTITVNGETVTLEQGENIVLDYPNEITSVKATKNTALTYIQIPNTVTSIEDGGKNDGAFYNCTALASVTLPNSLISIGGLAFNYCTALVSITIPEGVTSIGKNAFSRCTALASVTLPNSLISIGDNAFNHCTALVSITIPEGIKNIGLGAFYYCTSLGSVTIPEGVTSISNNTFSYCDALVYITIPETVTSIGDYALANCSKLTDFNFNGTMSQWASITKGTNWNKDAAFTVVHCTDGNVTL